MKPSVVTSADQGSWLFQQSYVERLMDHAALSSAHPDDTLLLAGPPRYGNQDLSEPSPLEAMLPIGMVQNINVTQTKPTQPLMSIGSGRMFFASGKAQGTAAMARLFCNGRNLLRVLYTNAVQADVDPNKFDDRAAVPAGQTQLSVGATFPKFFANLDSELFLIPFGLGCLFRDKVHKAIGAFYLELCMINNWTINFSAGQNLILENVNILFDRLIPIGLGSAGDVPTNYPLKDAELNTIFAPDGSDLYPNLGTK